jgi:HlyD family secretion protein
VLLRLPGSLVLPIGQFFILPQRRRILLWLLFLVGVPLSLYGLFTHRVDLLRDLERFLEPLNLFYAALMGMISANLVGQSARLAAYHMFIGKLPPFGIALFFSVLPRFYADLALAGNLSKGQELRFTMQANISSTLLLFVLATFGWIATRNAATVMPLVFLVFAFHAGLRFLLSINPLSRHPGYYLLAYHLGVPNLRGKALRSLVGRYPSFDQGRRREAELPIWGLRLYGFAVIVYLVTVTLLIVQLVGGWLERNWGGLGVVIFIGLIGLVLFDPFGATVGRRERRRAAQAAAPRPPRPWLRHFQARPWLVILLCVVALAWAGSRPYQPDVGGEVTLVPGSRVDVRALLPAQVVAINVEEGQWVRPGDTIAVLDADEEERSLAASQAKLRELESRLQKAHAGATAEELAQARAMVDTARTRYQFSRERAQRLGSLDKSGAVSREESDAARRRADIDRELLAEAERALALLEAGTRSEALAVLEAEVREEQAGLGYHEHRLATAQARSPAEGRVVSGSLQFKVGDYLEVGESLARVEDTRRVQAEVSLPESRIAGIRIGTPVEVKLWSFPDRPFPGTVASIAPQAEKKDHRNVFRVTIHIDNPDGLLQSGMSGKAKIAADELTVFDAFAGDLIRFVAVELWAWIP